jgi:hypothetical protein
MYDWNGKRPSVLRTKKPAVWSALDRMLRILPLAWPQSARLLTVAALLLLTALLLGCATPSTQPSVGPRNPTMPQTEQPQPSEPYLSRVQRNIELWEKKLLDMLGTP